ncbi:MAG TPA: glycosyltransferase [Pyrinomonadaceae bacterium]|nr:glycosyltransferase [Pyrinomonadaceae bacterium]
MANEEETAVPFVKAVLEQCGLQDFKAVDFFAILDEKSKDKTRALLENLAAQQAALHVVWAPETRCIAQAYVRGYREALAAGCDWILEMDSGFSHQPEGMSQFFQKMVEGYDCVFGSRFCDGGKVSESSLARYVISRGGTILSNFLLGTSLRDMTSGFELFTHSSLQYVLDKGIHSRSPFFQTEIRAYCHQFRIAEVPIHYRAASHKIDVAALGDSFSNLWRLFRLRLQGTL